MLLEEMLKQPIVHSINIYQYTNGYIIEENGKHYGYITMYSQHKLYIEDIQTINYNYGLNLTYDVLSNTGVRHLGYWYDSLDKDRIQQDLEELSKRLF